MNLFALTGVAVAFSCVVLTVITFNFGRTKLHYILGLFNIAVANWGIGLYLVGVSSTTEEAIISWKIGMLSGYFIGPLFYQMTTVFCGVNRRGLIYFGYGQAIFFVVLTLFTSMVISQMRYVYDIYFMTANLSFSVALIFYIFVVAASFFELFSHLKTVQGSKRLQILFVTFSFMAGFFGASSIFLPMYSFDFFYPAGNLLIVFYALSLTYAIMRHNVMDLL